MGSEPSLRNLRQGIDMPRWMTPPPAVQRFASPHIATAATLAPANICDWLVEQNRPRLKPADVYNPVTGQRLRNTAIRNNSVATFDLAEYGVILLMLRSRIAALANVAVTDLEPPTILHYVPDQQFGPHFDYLDPAQPALARNIARHGQRVGTVLVYLNDDYEGGETDFPELGWRHRGGKGDVLLFWSVDPTGNLDRRTLHAGLAPTRGEKWLLSQWIRRRVR